MGRVGRRAAWVFGVASLFFAALGVSWWLHDPADVLRHDPYYYWRMAEGHVELAPFGYRILVPSIVRVLPMGHHLGFVVCTAAAITVAAVALWLWLRRHTVASRAAAGVAIFLASGPVWFQLRSPYRSDAAMMAFLACCALFADRNRWIAFAIAGMTAVLARDAAAIVVVVPVLAWWQRRDRAPLYAAASIVVAVIAVRGFVPVIPRAPQDPGDILAFRSEHDGGLWRSVLIAVCSSFGPFLMLIPQAWRHLDANSKRFAAVAVAALPSLLIASDWSRLLAPLFPIVCIAAVRSRVRTEALYAVAAMLLSCSVAQPSLDVVLLATASGVAALWLGGRRSGEPVGGRDTELLNR